MFSSPFMKVLRESCRKILLFLFAVLILTIMVGVLMFFIEGKNNGFTSIGESIYWAIITLTTIGYGDIVPQTGIGGAVASILLISGYSIIIVPIAIVITEVYNSLYKAISGEQN